MDNKLVQASIIWCLSQARINWMGCGRKGIQRKNGGKMEMGASIVRMGCIQMDCQWICLCYLSMCHKIQKTTSNNEGSS